jgi:hypothetical protein
MSLFEVYLRGFRGQFEFLYPFEIYLLLRSAAEQVLH